MSQDYQQHLHDCRWEVIRYVNGKGIELNTFDGLVWPKSIKLLSKDDPVKYKEILRFVTKDFYTIPECEAETLDYVFVTEQVEGEIITDLAKEAWRSKLNKDGTLILHHLVDGEYTFEVFNKNGDKIDYSLKKQPKHALIIRLGAFGDNLQTSSVFPELKRQGYYLTVISANPGAEAILADPHIDELIIQEKEVVRNVELGKYWDWLRPQFDKFINLCESVEATWLPGIGKMAFHWPSEVRHKYLNKNYVEFAHELAQVPYQLRVKFYPTKEEIKWADEELARMKEQSPFQKLIVWSLSGSSVHKVYPRLDTWVARMMTQTSDTAVVFVGGIETFQLQGGWQDEPRCHLKVGKWTMRQSLVMTQRHASLVIGPETGLLNAMCVEKTPKIIFLSHSTKENLTRDWTNTLSLHADYAEMKKICDNCCRHRLHDATIGWDYVKRGPEFGAAMCQEKIDFEALWRGTVRSLTTGRVTGH